MKRYAKEEVPTSVQIMNMYSQERSLILKSRPWLINRFVPYLHELDGLDLYEILISQPGLIPYLKIYAHKISDLDLSTLMAHHPELAAHFKPLLGTLEGIYIARTLVVQPCLIHCFAPFLHKIDYYGFEGDWLFSEQPQLKKYFNPPTND